MLGDPSLNKARLGSADASARRGRCWLQEAAPVQCAGPAAESSCHGWTLRSPSPQCQLGIITGQTLEKETHLNWHTCLLLLRRPQLLCCPLGDQGETGIVNAARLVLGRLCNPLSLLPPASKGPAGCRGRAICPSIPLPGTATDSCSGGPHLHFGGRAGTLAQASCSLRSREKRQAGG